MMNDLKAIEANVLNDSNNIMYILTSGWTTND